MSEDLDPFVPGPENQVSAEVREILLSSPEPSKQSPSKPQVPQRSSHSRLGVFLATAGALILSIFNAAIFVFLICLGVIASGVVDVSAAEDMEGKMRILGEMKVFAVAAGVLGTSSALLMFGLGLTARPRGRMLIRLRLVAPKLKDLVLVTGGMLGLTHALGMIIIFLGLENTGSLAEFNLMFESWSFQEKLGMLPVLALCPGVAEEIFFRGYALTKLELAGGFRSAMIITAVLFGLIHLDPVHSVAAGLMGLYLAYAVHCVGSLWTTIVAHILNNAMAVLFPDLIPDTLLIQVLFCALGLCVCGGVLVIMSRRPQDSSTIATW
jgi:uncharacterized protein